jgi:SAM-dependent methyltransferase
VNDEYVVRADLYDFVVPYRTRPDVDFFVDEARNSGGPVLELGCGTGRVLIPTARAGVEIVGLDRSPQMLEVCRRKVQDESSDVQSRIRLIEGDMRRLELSQRFALVTIPFRPFQHLLEVDDQIGCLECVRRHLNDKGKLVLDVFNPSLTALTRDNLGQEEEAGPDFTVSDGRSVVAREKIVARDYFKQVISVELIYYVTHPSGRQERLVHAFQMRYFFRYEIEHLLARAGFETDEVYSDYQRNPYGATYPGELVFVVRKKRPDLTGGQVPGCLPESSGMSTERRVTE